MSRLRTQQVHLGGDMTTAVVCEEEPSTPTETGTLFQGQKFWFSASVPQRRRFIENVKANGGEVVPLENQADILLVDHAKKNQPPGTHSYRYVEESIRKNKLENLADYVVGGTLRADRPVGSVTMAPKASRNTFTEGDDQFLWNWVKPLEEVGAATSGNAIYQQLESVNPRHTYQSWRDRWLKYVRYQKRQITTRVHAEGDLQSTPRRQRVQPRADGRVEASPVQNRRPAEGHTPVQVQRRRQNAVDVSTSGQSRSPRQGTALPALKSRGKDRSKRSAEYDKSGKRIFSAEDYDELFAAAPYIMAIPADRIVDAWRYFARQNEIDGPEGHEELQEAGQSPQQITLRDAEERRTYFDLVVRPDYEEQLGDNTKTTTGDYLKESKPTTPIRVKNEINRPESGNNKWPNSPAMRYSCNPKPSSQLDSPIVSSSRPESRTVSSSTTQEGAPGRNEAQQLSTVEVIDVHEANSSTVKDADNAEDLRHRSIQSPKRKRNDGTGDEDEDSPSLPPLGNQEQAKRRKQIKRQPRSLEIPSTPESNPVSGLSSSVEEEDSSQETGSPTPRPRRMPSEYNPRDDIPSWHSLFPHKPTSSRRNRGHGTHGDQPSPPVGGDDNEMLPLTSRRRRNGQEDTLTSPLSVHLVSDHDSPAKLSSSQACSEKEQDSSSSTPEFKTVRELCQVWETAQDEADAAKPETQRLRDDTISETQLKEFALPEPEGGWGDVWAPLDAVPEGSGADEAESENNAEAESLGDWVAMHMRGDPDADDELLIRAAGIADLNFELADIVYQRLAQGKPVPENMKGVWTERDDNALRGNDANEIKRIEAKHGNEGLVGRWQWLENEQK